LDGRTSRSTCVGWDEGAHPTKLLPIVTYLFREEKLLVRDNIVNDNLAHDISNSTNIDSNKN
jgi:hypothetical protein